MLSVSHLPSQTWLRSVHCAVRHLDSECYYGNGGAGNQSQCLLGFGVPNNEQTMIADDVGARRFLSLVVLN